MNARIHYQLEGLMFNYDYLCDGGGSLATVKRTKYTDTHICAARTRDPLYGLGVVIANNGMLSIVCNGNI